MIVVMDAAVLGRRMDDTAEPLGRPPLLRPVRTKPAIRAGGMSIPECAGMLSVYDERCERHDVGPGEAYVGGDLR